MWRGEERLLLPRRPAPGALTPSRPAWCPHRPHTVPSSCGAVAAAWGRTAAAGTSGERCSSPMQCRKDVSSGAGDSTRCSVGTARGTVWGQAGSGAKLWAQPQPWLPARQPAEVPEADGQPELASATRQVWWSQSTAATSPPKTVAIPVLAAEPGAPASPCLMLGVLRATPWQICSGPAAQLTANSQPGAACHFGAICSAPAPEAARVPVRSRTAAPAPGWWLRDRAGPRHSGMDGGCSAVPRTQPSLWLCLRPTQARQCCRSSHGP